MVQEGPGPTAIPGDPRLPEALADGKERVYPNIGIPGRNEVIADVMTFSSPKFLLSIPASNFKIYDHWD